MALLDIENLGIEFGEGPDRARVVDGVSLRIDEGETLCLVGESGSGKSVTALAIARLLPPAARIVAGNIRVRGRDVCAMEACDLCALRGGTVAYVFQEPSVSLNPVMRIGAQIREALQAHRPELATTAEVNRLLTLVGIPAAGARARDYPHQLSGGMKQRVMIAMALAARPALLVADEPTTALDATIQSQILELLRDLQARLGMSILFITHHLGLVAALGDRVAVLYAGQVVEQGRVHDVLRQPLHPYTQALLRAVPGLEADPAARLRSIRGSAPSAGAFPAGCRFHPRCDHARRECAGAPPALHEVLPGRRVRCPFWDRLGEPQAIPPGNETP